jgi:D-glycero-D-manno-heptose 1,7-bisphosphate phosphatase
MRRPALFLDRDGVINEYEPYVFRKEHFRFVDGIFELVAAAQQRGYLTFVITNQAGIGRGLYTEDDFWTLTRWMVGRFAERGCRIDGVYYCPTHPQHGIGNYRTDSEMRKPRPGMLLKAAREHTIDLPGSVLVGDRVSDIEAGIAAGVVSNFLLGAHEGVGDLACRVVGRLQDVIPYLNAVDSHAASEGEGRGER